MRSGVLVISSALLLAVVWAAPSDPSSQSGAASQDASDPDQDQYPSQPYDSSTDYGWPPPEDYCTKDNNGVCSTPESERHYTFQNGGYPGYCDCDDECEGLACVL